MLLISVSNIGGVKGITIKPIANLSKPSGFKKGGFRNAFAPEEGAEEVKGKEEKETRGEVEKGKENLMLREREVESSDEEGTYDPRYPTGCPEGCRGRG